MSMASHHQHKRKTNKKNPYPHSDKKIQRLDSIVSVVSIISPLAALPQIHSIWVMKHVQGVSLLTWGLLLILGIPLFVYARVHKDVRLQIMFGLWCVIYIFAVVGLLLYQ